MNEKNQTNHDSVGRLLRLKRYEQPNPEFYEEFLRDFQNRQRAELLKPSLRQLIWDRFTSLLPDFRVPSYAYATIGLFAVAASAWILTSDELAMEYPQTSLAAATSQGELRLDLHSATAPAFQTPVEIPSQRMVGTLPPHYALEPRPNPQHEPFSF
jgi:hypothetical protein